MSLPIVKRPRVNSDILEYIGENPRIGRVWKSPRTRLRDVRFYPIPEGFRNYLIFYRVASDSVEILAVLHGALELESKVLGIDF